MAAANVNAVSVGIGGLVAGIGNGVCCILVVGLPRSRGSSRRQWEIRRGSAPTISTT